MDALFDVDAFLDGQEFAVGSTDAERGFCLVTYARPSGEGYDSLGIGKHLIAFQLDYHVDSARIDEVNENWVSIPESQHPLGLTAEVLQVFGQCPTLVVGVVVLKDRKVHHDCVNGHDVLVGSKVLVFLHDLDSVSRHRYGFTDSVILVVFKNILLLLLLLLLLLILFLFV